MFKLTVLAVCTFFCFEAQAGSNLDDLSENETNMLQRFPGLVVVKSIYNDVQDPRVETIMSGFGIIVRDDERAYVMTSSHLSQGPVDVIDRHRKKLGITPSDPRRLQLVFFEEEQKKTIEWTHSVANNFQDIEIFEIKNPQNMNAFAHLCQFSSKGNSDKFSNGLCVDEFYFDEIPNFENLRGEEFVPLGLKGFIPRPLQLTFAEIERDFPLVGANPSEVRDLVENPQKVISPFRFQTGMDVIDEQLWAPVKINPGMSGLPFVNTFSDNRPVVLGLVQGKAIHFDIGWITENSFGVQLIKLLQNMKSKGPVDVRRSIIGDGNGIIAEWQMNGGHLIRKGFMNPLQLVFYEAIPQRLDASQSQTIREETGNGSRADTGNGSRADTGDNLGNQSTSPWGMLVYTKLMGVDKLTDIIAIRVTGFENDFLMPANAAGMRILSNLYMYSLKKKMTLKIDFITPRSPLVDIIKEQVRQRARELSTDTFTSHYWGERYSYSPDIERLKTDLDYRFEGEKLFVSFTFKGDLVRFTLNRNGTLEGGDKTFSPIVEAKGESGDTYKIDLSNLFFFDVSRGSLRHPALYNRFMLRHDGIDYVFYNRAFNKADTDE